ncbi:MAG: hypothetical protein ACYCV1_09280, partial [Acidimicrobiales bacterium]
DGSAPPSGPRRTGCRFLAALRSRSKTEPQARQQNTRSDNSMRDLAFVPQLLHVWVVSQAGSTTTTLPAFFACHQRAARNWPHPASAIERLSPDFRRPG